MAEPEADKAAALERAADGWEAVEDHARERGWDEDELGWSADELAEMRAEAAELKRDLKADLAAEPAWVEPEVDPAEANAEADELLVKDGAEMDATLRDLKAMIDRGSRLEAVAMAARQIRDHRPVGPGSVSAMLEHFDKLGAALDELDRHRGITFHAP